LAAEPGCLHELDHDVLWCYWCELPERGGIGIFNRSYYEEVLVVRVHRAILEAQKLPPECLPKKVFEQRLADIAHFEDCLTRQGTKVLKFFVNVSRDEQKRRFMERLNEPSRNWKFSSADVRERGHWDDYQAAYEQAIRATATPHAPWYVVPADNKWYLRLVMVTAVVQALEEMDLAYPRWSRRRSLRSRTPAICLNGSAERCATGSRFEGIDPGLACRAGC